MHGECDLPFSEHYIEGEETLVSTTRTTIEHFVESVSGVFDPPR